MRTPTTRVTSTGVALSALVGDDTLVLPPEPTAAPDGVREPDFYDGGNAIWIGPAGAVGYDVTKIADVGRDLDLSGWFARRGVRPTDRGFAYVAPYRRGQRHAAAYGRHADAYTDWRTVLDAVLAESPGDDRSLAEMLEPLR
jgi:hypothetical protein